MSQPENPYDSPQAAQHYPQPQHGHGQGDATGGVIPYKNLPALLAYYLGLASLLPCVGFLFAVPALILGILGLRKRAQNPAVKGSVHAWIGIVMGGLFTLIWGAAIVLMIIGAMADV